MSIGGHLREFRNRAIVAGIAILIGMVFGWMQYQGVYDFLKQPITDIQKARPGSNVDINFNGVTAPFNLKLKVAAWIGFIVSSPVWLWEIWAFLVPGLTKKEARLGRIFVLAGVVLFSCGVYMGTLTFRNAVELLLGATPENAANLPTATEYFSFVTRFILAFGLSFLLPILLLALNAVGVLSGKNMLKGWRVAIIAITTFAAIMTPTPDVWSMFLLAGPLYLLFYGSVGIAMLVDKVRKRNEPDWAKVDDSSASTIESASAVN